MQLQSYHIETNYEPLTYHFTSVGPKGLIRKSIMFTEMNVRERGDVLFNLSFGDTDVRTGAIDDLARTNNGDTEKVLATVARAVLEVTDVFPDCWITLRGSTLSRTRLYCLQLSKHFDWISLRFLIWGKWNCGNWEYFQRNCRYDELLGRRR